MSNTFGKNFRLTTWGESHGEAVGCVIDGVPSNITIDEEMIRYYLRLRKPGSSDVVSKRREPDGFKILSGVFQGKTTGAPISVMIKNEDARSHDYDYLMYTFRPGHADYTYYHKYGNYDYRGSGRASARETVSRVVAGSIARQLLKERHNIEIYAEIVSIDGMESHGFTGKERDENFFTSDIDVIPVWDNLIKNTRKKGDSLAGKVRLIARNVPIGLGEPIYDKLDSSIAGAMMSIPGVKSITIGNENVLNMRGSLYNDQMENGDFLSNNCGGILGGISNGNELDITIVFKPTSSILIPQKTIDKDGNNIIIENRGRHDPCIAIRGVIVAESMLAMVLVDYIL